MHLQLLRNRGRQLFLIGLAFLPHSPIALAADPDPASKPGTTPPIASSAFGVSPSALPPTNKISTVENSVVKIFSTVSYPDFYKPWMKQTPHEISGSGVIIEGNRILTSARAVLYASQVQVQAYQSGDKVSATVESIAPGVDLAVLKINDDELFDSHLPLERAVKLPDDKDIVTAYGYARGSSTISSSKGSVVQIDFSAYNYPITHPFKGLRIQTDATISPGCVGGPVVVGDKLIGLAFNSLNGDPNTSYIVPYEEIDLFLRDVQDGHYDGKTEMTDQWQTIENPALRSFLKLASDQTGIVVTRPASFDPGYPLKAWDVITKIGESSIDDQGMIKLATIQRVSFEYMVPKLTKEGKLPLTVIRDGKPISVQIPVSPGHPTLLPSLNGSYPSYFVYGPLVFSNATSEFLGGYMKGPTAVGALSGMMLRGNPMVRRMGDFPTFPGERLVVVASPFFPDKLVNGYHDPISEVVKSVNGVSVKNLSHLVQLLHDSTDDFVTFDFGRDNEKLVFKRSELQAETATILSDNSILKQGSSDVLTIWNAPSAAAPIPTPPPAVPATAPTVPTTPVAPTSPGPTAKP